LVEHKNLWQIKEPLMPRLLALDFETNGLPDLHCPPQPWANYPVSVAIFAVSQEGGVEPLYSSRISGATAFNGWAARMHEFGPSDLQDEPDLEEVMGAMSALVKPGDVMVCHNISYDIERCLQNSCRLLDIDASAILSLPRFCTCRSEWAMDRNKDKWLSLAGLCAMYGVKNAREHTSGDDALALAQCLSKALTAKPGQDLGLADLLRIQILDA
jgi:DNA polymerase III epsilon subunit-like protein